VNELDPRDLATKAVRMRTDLERLRRKAV
jgi:hypothetical protein